MEKPEPGPFAARIRRRKEIWWGPDRNKIHRVRDCHARLQADASDSEWRCCPNWQRKLSNKWNAREFARRHGVGVPDLCWHGNDPELLPFDSLPDSYVIRATTGHSSKNVIVMDQGRNVFDGLELSRDEIRAQMWEMRRSGPSTLRFLVEERLQPEEGQEQGHGHGLLNDYKCHVVGEHIVAIQLMLRLGYGSENLWMAFYTPTWERMTEPLQDGLNVPPDAPPPRCLDEIVRAASILGRAYETYVRVDMYATTRGAVFGEFSPVSTEGHWFTPSGDALLEEAWGRYCPETT